MTPIASKTWKQGSFMGKRSPLTLILPPGPMTQKAGKSGEGSRGAALKSLKINAVGL